MAEVVDSIIAELVVRDQGYTAGFQAATKAANEHTDALKRMAAASKLADQMMTTPSARGTRGTAERQDADAAVAAVKKASKDKSDAEKLAAREAAASVRAAEREKTSEIRATAKAAEKAAADRVAAERAASDAIIAAAEREAAARARLEEVAAEREARRDASAARRVIGDRTVQPGSGRNRNPEAVQVPPQRPVFIPASVLNGGADAEVAAEAEINHLTVDRIVKQAALNTLQGAEKREQQDQIALLRLRSQLLAANVGEEEVLLRVETLRTAQAARANLEERAAAAKSGGSLKGIGRFAEGAGIGRTGGGGAALAGIVAGTAVAGAASLAKEGLDYANDLKVVSQQLGLTTKDLQIYQTAAEKVDVTNEQLRTAFGQLADNIGKAQQGAEAQKKIFASDGHGLNIDLGNARDGYKSLADVLPSVIERLSAIKDPARRAAVETELFGETGRKLDGVLSGGTGAIKSLGDELERTGGILSGEDIARSAKVAADLKRVGDQLERELASTVSQNAAAIETLATSLLNGAAALLKFVSAFERFRAQKQVDSYDPAQQASGRATLNQTPEGRQKQRDDIAEGLAAIREGGRNPDQATVRVRNGLGSAGTFAGGVLQFDDGFIANTPEARAAAQKTLLARRRETNSAERSAAVVNAGSTTPPQGGRSGDLEFLAGKGRRGKSAETLQHEADERTKRADDEIAQLKEQRLAVERELTVGAQAQLAADQASLKSAHDKRIADIDAQAKLKQIDASRVKGIKDEEEARYVKAQQLLALKEAIRVQDAAFQIEQDALAANLQQTRDEEALATTTDQRKRLALQALAIEQDKARGAAEHTINNVNPQVGDAERDQARADLARLPDQAKQQRAIINQDNAHPLDAYKHRLDLATSSTRDAIENVEVNALGKLEDQLSSSLTKVLGLKGAFGDLFGSILADLAKIEIERGILGVLGGGKSGVSSSGGIGGFFGTLLSAIDGKGGGDPAASIGAGANDFSFSGIPGFANGGSATIGGNPGVDGNLLSINGKPSLRVGQGEQLTITPNNQKVSPAVQGPAQIVQHITVDQRNSVVPAEFAGQILDVADARSRQHAAQAGQAAVSAAPGRIKSIQTLGS